MSKTIEQLLAEINEIEIEEMEVVQQYMAETDMIKQMEIMTRLDILSHQKAKVEQQISAAYQQ